MGLVSCIIANFVNIFILSLLKINPSIILADSHPNYDISKTALTFHNLFKSIINEKKFKATYGGINETDKLVRPPKGYVAENPAIEYLKLKNFTATMEISDADVLNKNLIKKVISSFETLSPLVHFLNKAIL